MHALVPVTATAPLGIGGSVSCGDAWSTELPHAGSNSTTKVSGASKRGPSRLVVGVPQCGPTAASRLPESQLIDQGNQTLCLACRLPLSLRLGWILSGDPTTLERNALAAVEVELTMVGGVAEYCSGDFADLCSR